MKKFGKQVSAEVKKDRAANKKAAVDSISRLRKVKAKSNGLTQSLVHVANC